MRTKKLKIGKVEPVNKVWLNMDEAMAYMGCSRNFIDSLKYKALLIPSKVSGKLFFNVHDINKLLEDNRII
ncbi:DNA-binding protein [uncultured Bacteroides sp.]|uniref:DNA-binding protein n=1 Tax=uncultured Bacteroides sp. TaxID=162156 RepID=UPI00260D66D3|nr:DNA-binding protein [uncultured Bacteroides sp.]